ncbi:adenylyl-sulfate kinase [Myxococcus sp. K38C18041901]|uniref:adenylyl-sulfate kinase n=1 Tax=Myxococcus guangdongensis TaxID=2906760 RepID=UPI0020A7430B|nr:adenylyl-sulfate kinase [Myxococcus guangdongensis]MCP3060213.1 adenylyl-sulfate kinase [Myxococcus guangdongensis]
MNRQGFILWLTGMSGAGKSTLSRALRERLAPERAVEVLDGDEVRTWLTRGLGFSREDREENARRIGHVARLLARHGVGVIVAAISPYQGSRAEVRALAAQVQVDFVEVYIEAPLDALISRDVKGLYKKALAGELPHFTGVSDPYEAPESPDVTVRSATEPVEAGVERVLDALRARGHLSPRAA